LRLRTWAGAVVPHDNAVAAVEASARFVEYIASLLAAR
jgi:hypothetical protein